MYCSVPQAELTVSFMSQYQYKSKFAQSGWLCLGSHAYCLCYYYVSMPTLCLNCNKMCRTYLKHSSSVTQELNSLKLYFKQFCRTKTLGGKPNIDFNHPPLF